MGDAKADPVEPDAAETAMNAITQAIAGVDVTDLPERDRIKACTAFRSYARSVLLSVAEELRERAKAAWRGNFRGRAKAFEESADHLERRAKETEQ